MPPTHTKTDIKSIHLKCYHFTTNSPVPPSHTCIEMWKTGPVRSHMNKYRGHKECLQCLWEFQQPPPLCIVKDGTHQQWCFDEGWCSSCCDLPPDPGKWQGPTPPSRACPPHTTILWGVRERGPVINEPLCHRAKTEGQQNWHMNHSQNWEPATITLYSVICVTRYIPNRKTHISKS